MLRIDDGPESWIISGGFRYPITSGTDFNCWVNPQFAANIEVDVYDGVTDTGVRRQIIAVVSRVEATVEHICSPISRSRSPPGSRSRSAP